jgi:hypothetical protein
MQARRVLILVVGLGAALNAVLWGVVLFLFPQDNPAAILHYSFDTGIDFIGEGSHITALPLMGAFLLVANTILGLAVQRTDRLAAGVVYSTIPLLQVVLLGAFYLLWHVNR